MKTEVHNVLHVTNTFFSIPYISFYFDLSFLCASFAFDSFKVSCVWGNTGTVVYTNNLTPWSITSSSLPFYSLTAAVAGAEWWPPVSHKTSATESAHQSTNSPWARHWISTTSRSPERGTKVWEIQIYTMSDHNMHCPCGYYCCEVGYYNVFWLYKSVHSVLLF